MYKYRETSQDQLWVVELLKKKKNVSRIAYFAIIIHKSVKNRDNY